MIHADVELDVSGLNCPAHVMRCKAALASMDSGQVLRLIATDLSCLQEIPMLVDRLGSKLLAWHEDGGKQVFHIEKGRKPWRPGRKRPVSEQPGAPERQSGLFPQASLA